jgi:hypothetical protein
MKIKKINNNGIIMVLIMVKMRSLLRYYEEARAGFYHVQKPSNLIGNRTSNFHHHNYDKIYPEQYESHPSNLLLLALQQRNLINQSNNSTTGYELPSIEESNYHNEAMRQTTANLLQSQKQLQLQQQQQQHHQIKLYSNDTSVNQNFILKEKCKSNDCQNDQYRQQFHMNLHHQHQLHEQKNSNNLNTNQIMISDLNQIRRSYSNSRLDHEKWQNAIAKNRPHMNNNQSIYWKSKIMSEHELKLFLNKKNFSSSKQKNGHMLQSDGMLQTSLVTIPIDNYLLENSNLTFNNFHSQKNNYQEQMNASNKNTHQNNKSLNGKRLFVFF